MSTKARRREWERQWAIKEEAKAARTAQRLQNLTAPITHDDISAFARHLVTVSFGMSEECWLYIPLRDVANPRFSLVTYANVYFANETVGAHKFALAASEGILLSELAGYDVHHASPLGSCVGYRCVNPEHLEKKIHVEHVGTRGPAYTVSPRLARVVSEVLEVHPSVRHPSDFQQLKGAASTRRTLGGVPFLIMRGTLDGIIRLPEAEETEELRNHEERRAQEREEEARFQAELPQELRGKLRL